MKDITGFEGLYAVDKKGNVWSYPKNSKYTKYLKGAWLKNVIDRGYEYVSLHKDGNQKKIAVHRVMALTYLDKDEIRRHVNHKNGIKDDNRLENLEWCTPKENCQHSWDNNLSKMTSKVRSLSFEKMKKWNSSSEGKRNATKQGKAKRKLSAEQIKQILKMQKDGISAKKVAKLMPVSDVQIYKIYRREIYKDIIDGIQ